GNAGAGEHHRRAAGARGCSNGSSRRAEDRVMGAVWMRARNEFRLHWRAYLSLALIAGLGAGAAIAAVAGARRTLDVYPRFRTATHAFDDLVGTNGDGRSDADQLRELTAAEKLPGITESSLTDAFTCTVTGPSG